MTHPTPWEFNPVHHPSYIDFFEQVLSETTDPIEVADRFEESFATDPWYIHLYRTGHAYHGVHPFYMWYWCAHALQHLGGVIIVGGDAGRRPPPRLPGRLHPGRRPGDGPGRGRTVTHADPPPRPADPHGRRPVRRRRPTRRDGRRRVRPTPCGPGGRSAPTRPWAMRRANGSALGPGRHSAADHAVGPAVAGRTGPLPAGRTELARVGPPPGAHARTRRALRHRVVPQVPGPPGPGHGARQRGPAPGPGGGLAPDPGRGGAGRPGGPGHLRRQPRQSRRHPAAAELPPPAVPPPDRGGGRRRLLLRPPVEGRRLVVPSGRHPHRADQGQPAVGRPGRRAAGGRAGTSSSSPRADAPPTGGPRPSGAVRPTWPPGPVDRWCRSTSTGPGTSCPRGGKGVRRTRTTVTFGTPLWPEEGEDARRFGVRIEAAVATMAHEADTDWWTARRAGRGRDHPGPAGPRRRRLAPVVGAGRGARPAGPGRRGGHRLAQALPLTRSRSRRGTRAPGPQRCRTGTPGAPATPASGRPAPSTRPTVGPEAPASTGSRSLRERSLLGRSSSGGRPARPARPAATAPTPAAGRPGRCCGPAAGRADSSRAPAPTTRPPCRHRHRCPRRGPPGPRAGPPAPTVVTPPWFSNPVSRGSGCPPGNRGAVGRWPSPPTPRPPADPCPLRVVTSSRPRP